MFALLCISLAFAGGAPAPADVQWTAPEACPPARSVENSIRAQFDPERTGVTRAAFEVAATDDGFVMEAAIVTDGVPTQRTLEARSCDDLATAAVWLTGVAVADAATQAEAGKPPRPTAGVAAPTPTIAPVDGVDITRSTDATAPAQQRPPTRAASPEVRDRRPPPARKTPPPANLGIRVAALGGFGAFVLPAGHATLDARASLTGAHWSVGLAFTHRFARTVVVGSGAHARFQLSTLSVRGCGVPGVGRLEFPLCGAALAGVEIARGTAGLRSPDRAQHPWFGLGASAGARLWWHPRFAVLGEVSGLLTLARPDVQVGGIGRVCCGRGGVTARVGFAVRFGLAQRQRNRRDPDNPSADGHAGGTPQ